MRRFYALSTQPTMFGEMSLIRNWGRIGTNGKTMMQTFDGTAEAVEAFGRLERAKRRRGYAAVDEKLSRSDQFLGDYGSAWDAGSICSAVLMSDEPNRNKTELVP